MRTSGEGQLPPQESKPWYEGKGRYISPELYPPGFDLSIISKIEVTPLGGLKDYNNMAHDRLLIDPKKFQRKAKKFDEKDLYPHKFKETAMHLSQKMNIYNQRQLDEFMHRRTKSQKCQPRWKFVQ